MHTIDHGNMAGLCVVSMRQGLPPDGRLDPKAPTGEHK
jgi:hypothetical protein